MRLLLAFLAIFFASTMAFAQEPAPTVTPELQARASANDLDAVEELALAYAGQGDIDAAIRWARRAADAGRPEAMNTLAIMLRARARGRDLANADRWETRAIEAGSQMARLNRGVALIVDAQSEDWRRGVELLQTFEHPEAASMLDALSLSYEETNGAIHERARVLTGLAAQRGAPAAQWRYAMMLIQGVGGPTDATEAFTWVQRAAEGGELRGLISTAVMYATGEGVARDSNAAAAWYQRAIDEHQSAHALRGLGGMYLSGELPSDPARGWAYLELAANAGDTMAPRLMRHFAAQATPEVRAAARIIGEAWVIQNGRPQ